MTEKDEKEIRQAIHSIEVSITQYNEGAVLAGEMFANILDAAIEAYEAIEPTPEEIAENRVK